MKAPRLLILLLGLGLAAGAAEAAKPKTLGDLSGRKVELPPDEPITDAERKARENYQQYLDRQADDPERSAEALRRLGDLELEAGESGALKSGADQLMSATYAAAVARYRERLQRFPNDPNNDQVLYQLARAQESGGDGPGALLTLDQLVSRYPRTGLLDEVQFRRGELLFARGRYGEAESAYRAALAADPKSEFREPARYKLGWSRLRQDRYGEALDAFFELLDARFAGLNSAQVDPALAKASPAARELVDDGLRAMSLCLSSQPGTGIDNLKRALAARRQPAYGHLLYLSLAGQYLEQKRYQDAAAVLTGVVDAQPLHPRAPELLQQAAAALEEGQFPAQVLAVRERYVERFGLDQPYWKAQGQPPSEAALGYLRDSLWLLTQQQHSLAQTASTPTAQKSRAVQQAATGYRRYASYFPQDARAAQARFLLGEVLFDGGDYVGALAAYEAAAYEPPLSAQSAESGYAALQAYQRREAQLSGAEASAWKRRRYAAELRFANAFPAHPQAASARLDAAEGLLAANAPDQALLAAQPLTIDAKAAPAARRSAWLLSGHARVDLKDFAGAEAAYLEAQRLDQASGKRDPQLAEHLAAAVYRQGEQARAAGQGAQAAAAFLRVGQVAPQSTLGSSAGLEAAQAYLSAGQTAAALPVLQDFLRQSSDGPQAAQAQAKLALAYLSTGNEPAAAATFERLAANSASSRAEQKEALQQAAKLYGKQKDASGEARVLGLLVSQHGQDFAAALEWRQRLIDLAIARNDNAALKSLSEAQITADAQAGQRRSPRSRLLAAQATMRLAAPLDTAFQALTLTQPLKNSLKRKKDAMEAALAAYGRAADYGVAGVLNESTYKIGGLYQGLAKALNQSERPKKLDAQAREEYELLLQEQAYPFEEKAIELHEANVRRVKEGLYDEWVRRSYASLAELVPGRYARPSRGAAYVESIR